MNPFAYPKSRHMRRLRPGPFTAYSDYKPFLRLEFEKKCIYCRMPDTMKDYEMYGVDHYRPKSLFPELLTTYSNLFYCCNPCNRRKRQYWPVRGRTKSHFIPNPCNHEMFTHLRFAAAKVQARTTAGAWTNELLDLNDPGAVEYRRFILEALTLYEGKRKEARDALGQLRRMKTGTPRPASMTRSPPWKQTLKRSSGSSRDLRDADLRCEPRGESSSARAVRPVGGAPCDRR